MVTTTGLNTKISEIKKTDYGAKISEIEKKTPDHYHDKYNSTTEEFVSLIAVNVAARLKQSDNKLIGFDNKNSLK